MLVGKIDNCGVLYLSRAGKFKEQIFPYSDGKRNCGDHCPQFGEWVLTNKYVELCLCGKFMIRFDLLIDERGDSSTGLIKG